MFSDAVNVDVVIGIDPHKEERTGVEVGVVSEEGAVVGVGIGELRAVPD